MADIFISYARENAAKAELVASELTARGWSVWWDRQIPQGSDFRKHIEGQIRAAHCVIVLWSSASINSSFVCDEAEEATEGKLVPALIERVKPPLGFRGLQAADLSEWNGGSDHVEWRRLVTSIRALFHGLPTYEQGARLFQLDTTVDIMFCTFSPSGRRILSSSPGNNGVVWNVEAGERIHTLVGHPLAVWSCDESFVLSCGVDGSVRLWDVETGTSFKVLNVGQRRYPVALSADGTRALFSQSPGISLWNLELGEKMAILEHPQNVNCRCLAWSSDQQYAVAGFSDGAVRVWSLATQQCQQVLESRRFQKALLTAILDPVVTCISVSARDGRILCGYSDGRLRLWDLDTGRCYWTSPSYGKHISCVLWSTDYQYVLSGSKDRAVRVYETSTGKLHHTHKEHKAEISALSWLQSSQSYASLDCRGTVRLWEIPKLRNA